MLAIQIVLGVQADMKRWTWALRHAQPVPWAKEASVMESAAPIVCLAYIDVTMTSIFSPAVSVQADGFKANKAEDNASNVRPAKFNPLSAAPSATIAM
jgi:hypothetical protein